MVAATTAWVALASRLAHVGVDSCNCYRKRAAPLGTPHAALVSTPVVTQALTAVVVFVSAPSVINYPPTRSPHPTSDVMG